MRVVVGMDPSRHRAGWGIVGLDGVHLASGEGTTERVVRDTLVALPSDADVVALTIEGVYSGKPLLKPGHQIHPKTYWTLGYSAGWIAAALLHRAPFASTRLWRPEPEEWRSHLGFRRKKRDAIARDIRNWCEQVTGVKMVGPRGGRQNDRAMAVGMAYAALRWLAEPGGDNGAVLAESCAHDAA